MEFPDALERVTRLEEAVAVIRALWAGGPVTRPSPFYPLRDAVAFPVPEPPPKIIVGGETRSGAALAARIGDGWTAFDDNFEANLPVYLEALEDAGRSRDEQTVIVGFQGGWEKDASVVLDSPWVTRPREEWERWREAGADAAVVTARSTEDIDALVASAARW
jgi:alkanesulfonate monooxygenase SsuD/methylene tetrahydromethanopterin reductase-like flavin-dependent oxidoreductase (luciferase family)